MRLRGRRSCCARSPAAVWTLTRLGSGAAKWLAGELEAEREADTQPGEVYEDLDSFEAALRGARRG